jgi:hypothetical protein
LISIRNRPWRDELVTEVVRQVPHACKVLSSDGRAGLDLGLDLDDPGFHHSVLGDFRERLLEEGRTDRLLDLALARLKEADSSD